VPTIDEEALFAPRHFVVASRFGPFFASAASDGIVRR
jgi:hypothetical protein